MSNRFLGNKRSNSDSQFTAQDHPETLHWSKMLRNGPGSLSMNMNRMANQPPRGGGGQISHLLHQLSSSRFKDENVVPSVISQTAADEGSRTGMKGPGVMSPFTMPNPSRFECFTPSRPESSSSEEAQAVTPWVVSGNVDHEKVIEKFGCDRIDEWLIARVERLTASAGADYYLSSSKKNRAYSKTKIAPLWGVWIQRKLFSEREDVSGLLMASKICGERSGLAEEGIDYARRSLGNECVQLDARLSEGMQALESADITDPRVLHRLALENAEERKLDSALAYAKHALKLGAESDLEVWLLLARVLSAQKRFSDAETIVDAALNETGKWEQGKLLRLKEKFRVAKGEVKDAIVTYTQLLALLQVQSKSLSSAKKMPKGYYVEGCLIISGRCVLETILLMEAMKSGMILMVDWKRLIR
ncbi:hypothetical protein YC2023_072468 [Brassica napus]